MDNTNAKENRLSILLALVVIIGFALPLGASPAAADADNNPGTVKVHNNITAEPDERNEPHVSCDFWVEGFNMDDDTGWLEFWLWPPSGPFEFVSSHDWSADSGSDDDFHFLAGPFNLSAGHYRVDVYEDEGHPGNNETQAKSKVFWVDECVPIPNFPGLFAGSLAMVAGIAAYVGLRRRRP